MAYYDGYIWLRIKMVYFISDKSQSLYIMIAKLYSIFSTVNHGIPQLYVIFLSIFSIYIRTIAVLINNFPNIHYHNFSDYIQLFTIFLIHYHKTINSELIECANCIILWLLFNKPPINSSTTIVLNISTCDTCFPNFILNNMIIYPSYSSKSRISI